MTTLKDIRIMTLSLVDDELSALRLEEELLLSLVKSCKHSLKTKKEAIERMKSINEKQISLLECN